MRYCAFALVVLVTGLIAAGAQAFTLRPTKGNTSSQTCLEVYCNNGESAWLMYCHYGKGDKSCLFDPNGDYNCKRMSLQDYIRQDIARGRKGGAGGACPGEKLR